MQAQRKIESGTKQFCYDAHRATMAHGTQNFVPCACFCYQSMLQYGKTTKKFRSDKV